MKKTLIALTFVAALVGSIFATLLQERSIAARNSGGTYSLYTPGNPVVTGTTISSTTYNATLNDLAAEMTNSLDRNGHGAMLAPLKLTSGSAAAPSLEWSSDTNSGLYRSASHDLRFSVNGTDVEKWTTTGETILNGLTITQSQSNVTALTGTGNGTAAAGTFLGGSSGGPGIVTTGNGTGAGLKAIGGSDGGPAVLAIGIDGGYGVYSSGGSGSGIGVGAFGGFGHAAIGLYATGGPDGGIAGVFTGHAESNGIEVSGGITSPAVGIKAAGGTGSNGAGGWFIPDGTGAGIRADPGSSQVAVDARGVVDFRNSVTLASSDVAAGVQSRENLIVAWASFTVTSAGGGGNFTTSLEDGFHIFSVARTGASIIRVTFAGNLANATFAPMVLVTGTPASYLTTVGNITRAVGSATFGLVRSDTGSLIDLDAYAANTWTIYFTVVGRI